MSGFHDVYFIWYILAQKQICILTSTFELCFLTRRPFARGKLGIRFTFYVWIVKQYCDYPHFLPLIFKKWIIIITRAPCFKKSKVKRKITQFYIFSFVIALYFHFFSYFAMTKLLISRIFFPFFHIDMRQDRAYASQKVKSNSPCFKNKSFLFSVNFFSVFFRGNTKKNPDEQKKRQET